MTIEIKLTPGDLSFAQHEGVARYNYNRAKGHDISKQSGATWVEQVAHEVAGCLGELAIARWLDNFPFSTFADRKDGDVGEFEVRATAYATGKLLLQKNDNPERKYLLVTLPTVYTAYIHGWMWGYEGMVDEYYNTSMRNPCFAIQQQYLKDPRSLLHG